MNDFDLETVSLLEEKIVWLEDGMMDAWGIIANVSGGDFDKQAPFWKAAVVRWMNEYLPPLSKDAAVRALAKVEEPKV